MTRQVFDLRSSIESNQETIKFLVNSYMISASIFACVECDIFTLLDNEAGLTKERLSEKCGLAIPQLQKLISFCMSLGLIAETNGRLQVCRAAQELLSTNSPENICAAVRHHQRHSFPLFSSLTDSLRDEQPIYERLDFLSLSRGPDFYREICRHENDLAICIHGMNVFSRGAGNLIAKHIPESVPCPKILDLGGGGGQVAMEIASSLPSASIITIDLPHVTDITSQLMAKCLVGRAVTCLPGDIFNYTHEYGMLFDIVLLSSILGDWGSERHTEILHTAHRNLTSGGLLMISETLLDESKTGPILPTLMSMYAQVITEGGKNLTASELVEQLDVAEFEVMQIVLNREQATRDLIIARKK